MIAWLFVLFAFTANAQSSKPSSKTPKRFVYGVQIATKPARFKATDRVKITIDVSKDPVLANAGDLYVWAWSEFGTQKVKNGAWNASDESQKMTKEAANVFSFSLVPAEYYGDDPTKMTKIQFLAKTKSAQNDTKSDDIVLYLNKTVEETEQLLANQASAAPIPVDYRNAKIKVADIQSPELVFEKMEAAIGKNLKVKIDPKIELLYTIGLLNGYPFIIPKSMGYKTKILSHFAPYQSDPDLRYLRKLFELNSIDGPVFLIQNLNDNFEPQPTLPKSYVDMLGGVDSLHVLLTRLKQFCVKTKYGSFFNSQRDFYNIVLKNTAFAFNDFNDVELLEEFYGAKHDSYSIVLNCLFQMGNFGVIRKTFDGQTHLYAVIEPASVENGIPIFRNSIDAHELVIHEFSHSFVNPVVDMNAREVNKYSYLYKPLRSAMQAQGYYFWLVTVKEQMVRAATCMIAEMKYGPEISKQFVQDMETVRRFVFTDAMVEKLRFYTANRSKYPKFSDYLPELLKVYESFDEQTLKEQNAKVEALRTATQYPKINTIDAAFDPGNLVFIVATKEKTEQGNNAAAQMAAAFNANLPNPIKTVPDTLALTLDLADKNLLVIGTVEGNLFAKKYFRQLPLVVTDSYVITDKIIKGERMQLMASWVSPLNANRSVAYFTAQNAIDIKDYLYCPYKGGNYWIGMNLSTIEAGNYSAPFGRWKPVPW
jgi:hypothetical protein